jgi:D-alanyl-D-alanine carboxypeptidase (penicillin-binding protein 5/6)
VAARSEVKYRPEDRVELVPSRPIARVLRRGERASVSLSVPRQLEGPLPRGARAGTMTVRLRGRVIATVPLLTAQPVPEVSVLERAADLLMQPGTLAVLALAIVAGGMLVTLLVRRRRSHRRAVAGS